MGNAKCCPQIHRRDASSGITRLSSLAGARWDFNRRCSGRGAGAGARRAARALGIIRAALVEAEGLVLATDPDREGEAIAWQVLSWLQERDALGDRPVRRVTFHEITREAVREAMARPRSIDMDLVRAQQARRALDYLVGFGLSPVLWRKVPGCRSAGRVPSSAAWVIIACTR